LRNRIGSGERHERLDDLVRVQDIAGQTTRAEASGFALKQRQNRLAEASTLESGK
jgi:hypothetical protein